MNVKIKLLNPEAKIPKFGTKHAAAADIYATEIIKESEGVYLVKFGFSIEFDPEYRFMIVPRSSFTKYGFVLQNSPGIGDADYRGEYSARFRAIPEITYIPRLDSDDVLRKLTKMTQPEFPYKVGERVAQCYFEKNIPVNWVLSQELSETERGEGGYGSTGNK